jgi:hypothetical protein
MRQVELNRILSSVLRAQAKRHGWRSVGAQAYWRVSELFFALSVTAVAREHSLHHSLSMKWFTLDRLLWRILGMTSNESQPLSLHATGAFTIAGQELLLGSIRNCVWNKEWLAEQLRSLASSAESKAAEVADAIDDIDDYLAFVEQDHVAFLVQHPRAVVNIWKERLLVAMEKGDREGAAAIAAARVAAQDTGTFMSDGRTFFELAAEHLAR